MVHLTKSLICQLQSETVDGFIEEARARCEAELGMKRGDVPHNPQNYMAVLFRHMMDIQKEMQNYRRVRRDLGRSRLVGLRKEKSAYLERINKDLLALEVGMSLRIENGPLEGRGPSAEVYQINQEYPTRKYAIRTQVPGKSCVVKRVR